MVLKDFEIWCFGEIIKTCRCSKSFYSEHRILDLQL